MRSIAARQRCGVLRVAYAEINVTFTTAQYQIVGADEEFDIVLVSVEGELNGGHVAQGHERAQRQRASGWTSCEALLADRDR